MKKSVSAITILLWLLIGAASTSCGGPSVAVADRQMARGEYYDASRTYRQVYNRLNKKTDREKRGVVALKLAEAHRRLNQHARAATAYTNALRYGSGDSTAVLRLAQSLHATGKYAEAAVRYREYLDIAPDNREAVAGLKGALEAKSIKDNPTRYIVKPARTINSQRADFAPQYRTPDELYFTTTNEKVTGKERSEITGMKKGDIWFIRKDGQGNWLRPQPAAGELNSENDEGIVSFSPDGNTMYLTGARRSKTSDTGVEILVSHRDETQWSRPERLQLFSSPDANCGHPAVSPSGDYLYFTSDFGGHGQKDLWRVAIIGDKPSSPENLGPSINTPGNEEFPYILTDSIMFFSSDGHPGMGGLDIFMAELQPSGEWNVTNMGVPINSAADDFGITFDPSRDNAGFFSTGRDDARGYDHIYSFELPRVRVTLRGIVCDLEDNPIGGAVVRIVGNDGSNRKTATLPDGTFSQQLDPGVSYAMLAGAPDYLNARREFTTDDSDGDYYATFRLASVSRPNTVENILYDFDSAVLRPESKSSLDSLASILRENPTVKVELGSHTDRKGSENYNLRLSERRAMSVIDYLVSTGIAQERLTYKGYGKSTPKTVTRRISAVYPQFHEGDVLTPDYIDRLPNNADREIADQINRRTEFKVLSTDYNK